MDSLYRIILIVVLLISGTTYAQEGAPSCAELQAHFELYQSCATNIPFQNSTGNISGETLNQQTSCIPTNFHGPTWFFMQIQNSGDIQLQISQVSNSGTGTDVDFAIWGPFTDMNNICNLLAVATEVDCSYSGASVEQVNITAAQTGEYYVLLVDNFDNVPGQISIAQTGGDGSSDCGFLSSVVIKDTAGNEITQLDYCLPDTKDIVATVDTSDFEGNVADLRFNYKWYKDDLLIVDLPAQVASTNTLTVTATGTYKIELSAYDSTDPDVIQEDLPISNDEITLTFYSAPNFTVAMPASQCLNDNPTLQVTDNSIPAQTYAYQWYRNNVAIAGQTNSSFTPTLAGNYTVRVSNPGCTPVDSSIISIYQKPTPVILDNQTICANDSYAILSSVTNASQMTSLSYQWLKDGNQVSGATASSYVVSAANQAVNTTSVYSVKVTEQNLCATTSNSVSITINPQPNINTTPISLHQCDYIGSNTDGLTHTNLTQVYGAITNGDNALALSYFYDSALTQPIANPQDFTNTIAFNQNIYVRGVYPGQVPLCSSATATIALTVDPTTIANYTNMAPVCPIVNTNSGTVNFDSQRVFIKNTYYPLSNVDIVFYSNPNDAAIEQNALTNSSLLPVGVSTIYTRIETSNNCEGIGTFQVEVKAGPPQNTITPINVCKSENVILSNKDSEALAGQATSVQTAYFYSFDNAQNNTNAINKNAPVNLAVGSTPVFVRLLDTSTQCYSVVNFDANVFPNPTIVAPDPITICGSGTAIFNLTLRNVQIVAGNTDYQVNFYETQADLNANNPITNSDAFETSPKTIIVRVTDPTNNNCTSTTTLQLNVTESPGSPNNPNLLEGCDDSGFFTFDLTEREFPMTGTTPAGQIDFKYYIRLEDAEVNNGNTISTPEAFTNTEASHQTIYVRINSKVNFDSESGEACYRILEQELFVRPFPENLIHVNPYKICVDINNNVVNQAFIDTQLSETDYDFIWFNGFDAVTGNEILTASGSTFSTPTPGEYSVKITNLTNQALCSTVANFTTENTVIPFSIVGDPSELVAFEVDNTITAIVTPQSNDFEYQLNDNGWQYSNVFYNVKGGIYKLTVRNKYGCGEVSTEIVVVDFPRFFTPNGDGFNDLWNIGGRVGLDISNVYIFDRFGKLIKEIFKNETGWDGTLNGKPLPSDDYWFKIVYVKNGVNKEFLGHFALKR
ncbi:MAG: T9SS type B sorting domain-containing protein [Flavobacterium sp.]|nr:T9SS type B sorting domain-containing protein [Flavobacterium sp.]